MRKPPAAKKRVKLAFLKVARALGLFALARLASAHRLRILCYHAFGTEDDIQFSPGLFMRLETIRQRFELIRQRGYHVMPLGEAVEALQSNRLPRLPLVITFDDGFHSNFDGSRVLMQEFALPLTLYVTTYYVAKNTPILSHAVRYLFFKTRRTTLSLAGLAGHARSAWPDILDLRDHVRSERVMWSLIIDAETHMTEPERVELCRELGLRLGVDYDKLAAERRVSMLTCDEIRELSALGMDIELHTHRHTMPLEAEALRREIEDNRAVLESATGKRSDHLCYPSGVYSDVQWPTLRALGIRSATTCEPGLNGPRTAPLQLARYLDFEDLTELEIDAALSGFLELPRGIKKLLSPHKVIETHDVNHPTEFIS